MLELRDVRKSYTTADFTQVALDDVSIAFRDNEFVAILGPSGSGKTTLLNIVGGLDHYDSGNLIIDGIQTSTYRDRDWDTYRTSSSRKCRTLCGRAAARPAGRSRRRSSHRTPHRSRALASRRTRSRLSGPRRGPWGLIHAV